MGSTTATPVQPVPTVRVAMEPGNEYPYRVTLYLLYCAFWGEQRIGLLPPGW